MIVLLSFCILLASCSLADAHSFKSVGLTEEFDVLVGASLSEGIMLSNNHGLTWYQSPAPVVPWNSISMSVDGKVLAATAAKHGLFISADFGTEWKKSKLMETEDWKSIKISSSGQYMFACTEEGVYRSENFGESWEKSLEVAGNWHALSMDGSGKYGVVVGLGEGIYVTSDYGRNWVPSNVEGGSWVDVVCDETGQKWTVVGLAEGIYISEDYGMTWEKADAPELMWRSVSISGQYQAAVAQGDHVYLSTDAGKTWHTTFSPKKNWLSVIGKKQGTTWYALAEGENKMYSSEDSGITWKAETFRFEMSSLSEQSKLFRTGGMAEFFKKTNLLVTGTPTHEPSAAPSSSTKAPTFEPSAVPTTIAPSQSPTAAPSTAAPSRSPTAAPSTAAPSTAVPSAAPSTAVPSFAPTTRSPTTAPSTRSPTAAPSTQGPTVAPSTQAPSFAPTFAPSATPTGGPTAAPTTQVSPIVNVASNYTLTNVTGSTLSENSTKAIEQAIAKTVDVPEDSVSVTGYTSTASSRRRLVTTTTTSFRVLPVAVAEGEEEVALTTTPVHYTFVVNTLITLNLVDYPEFSSATALASAITTQIAKSVSSGNFTKTLISIAQTTSNSQLFYVNASAVTSTYTVVAPPADTSSTKKGLTAGEVAAIVICSVFGFCVIAALIYFFLIQNKRTTTIAVDRGQYQYNQSNAVSISEANQIAL